ncbi:unnamed protein product [Ostreobium quekettii]|uniref:RING-type domain-containing protein n=1 Tax=Ostreobium quekettii TaxID=121088 RepID=A0A8S1IRT8_9CHLO|nr:unnamed protein product [Ostreobium quekettii]|eukprot:evm.model.scf_65.14 EVM.evm.TU.scf_65.14   scf_65:104400-108486(+)
MAPRASRSPKTDPTRPPEEPPSLPEASSGPESAQPASRAPRHGRPRSPAPEPGPQTCAKDAKDGGGAEGTQDCGCESGFSSSTNVCRERRDQRGAAQRCYPDVEELQCSICYELLLDPVVGSCGHDFCRHCFEEWKKRSRKRNCPICRKRLPSDLGVCGRLKDMIEKLFPNQSSIRRQQVESWQKEAQELGGGARDADLEALMAQISHLLEDANSGAEMDGSEDIRNSGDPAGALSNDDSASRPAGPSDAPPRPSTSAPDAAAPGWTRHVRPRSSLLANVAFTMGSYHRRRRRFRASSSQSSGAITSSGGGSASAGASGPESRQSRGGVSHSIDGGGAPASQAAGSSQQSVRRPLPVVDEQDSQGEQTS